MGAFALSYLASFPSGNYTSKFAGHLFSQFYTDIYIFLYYFF